VIESGIEVQIAEDQIVDLVPKLARQTEERRLFLIARCSAAVSQGGVR
jgi:hypothetical protein